MSEIILSTAAQAAKWGGVFGAWVALCALVFIGAYKMIRLKSIASPSWGKHAPAIAAGLVAIGIVSTIVILIFLIVSNS